jgi:transposase
VPIDLAALPDDAATLQQMLREVVAAAEQQQVALQGAVSERDAEIEKLRLLIQRLLRQQFGRRSEKLSPDQLQLGLEDLEQDIAAGEAAQGVNAPQAAQAGSRRQKDAERNHGALPSHLPRYEVVIDIASRDCPCCGGQLHPIGELRSEQLDIVPAQLRVRVTRRPRYACRSCQAAVVVAPAPERPIDGGMATEALVVHVAVSKFCDALPLYRQSKMLERQGITLDRSTLSNWVGRACWWLTPLYELLLSTAMSSAKLFADDTTLAVLDPGRGKTKTGRLWCYAVDDRPWAGAGHPIAAYVYSEDRKNIRPANHLADFRGVLQVDGYDGFKRLAGNRADASVTLAFCWAHMRRPFFEFHASTQSPLAAKVLAEIARLYAIEAEIRGQPAERRRQVRQERSRPIVEALHAWLLDHVGRVSAVSDLAKAIRYALRHWTGLIAFLDDGRIEMGRVEVWRGCCRLNVSVAAPFVWRCLTGSSLAPSPHPARQTGRADFPHPAFSRSVRPSLSAGRHAAVGHCRGRVSRRDTRLGSGGTQRLVAPRGASTSDGPVVPCMPERAHRFL